MTLRRLIKTALPETNVAALVRQGDVTIVRSLGWAYSYEEAKSPVQGVKRATFVDVRIASRQIRRIVVATQSIDWQHFGIA